MDNFSIENRLLILEKYDLTEEELFLVDLLFMGSIEEGHPEFLIRYMKLPYHPNLRTILINLKEKGILLKSYKIPDQGQPFDPESIEFNKNFIKNYKKYSNELGKEFFTTYPSIGLINGREVGLKNYAKKFNSSDEMFFAYGKAIGWNYERHKEILKLVEWAKDNNINLLNMNIADFIISNMWNSLKELKDGNNVVKFDSIVSI